MVLNFGGRTEHLGIVGDKLVPEGMTYECFVDDEDAGCFAYAGEIEKIPQVS